MGRQPEFEPAAMEADTPHEQDIGGEPVVSGSFASSSEDICTNLLERYGKSAAPQHRHLCACACAIRSLLTEEGLPLNPASYFAAVLTDIHQADLADRDEVAALSSFLSILIPLLPARSLPELKAKEASSDVMSLLQSSSEGMSAPTTRSLIGALGILVLCLDLDDWSTLQTPLEMLFSFSVDRRPKIRRSAQESLEKVFATFGTSTVRKKISGFLISLFKKYVCIDTLNRSQIRNLAKSEHMEALHVLYLMKLTASNIPKKTIRKLLPDIYKLLGCQSIFTRHALMVLEVLLGCLDTCSLASESDIVIATLSSYISNRKNHIDTILSASILLKNVLSRLHDVNPKLWTDHFPLIFSLLSGFLDSKTEAAGLLAGILKELINFHIDKNEFPSDKNSFLNNTVLSSSESRAMEAVCIILEKKLSASDDFPNEHILAVVSDLFLKLGQISFIFMKNIILKLSERTSDMEVAAELNQLQVCLGSAIVAIGSERMLSLFPVSFDEETFTCSNVWLLPLLKRYVNGGSLQYFIENLMPVATSIMAASKKVEDSTSIDKLEPYMIRIWDLLPSFCHHTSNISENFKVLAPLFIIALKEEPSLHKTVSASLKVLVRSIIQADMPEECVPASTEVDVSDHIVIAPRCLKKVATKSVKAVATSSMDVIGSCIDAFFNSKPENRLYLKDAVESLTSIIGRSNIRKIFLTIAEKIDFGDNEGEEVADKPQIDESEKVAMASSSLKDEKLRSLAIELMCCIISRANKDLINEIFNCIKPCILAVNGPCTSEAYQTLSKILKDHSWFVSEHTDDLMEMLLGTKSIHDANFLKSRFSCLEILLTNFVKSKEEIQKKKAFPLLNEIILALKDSDAEVRKIANDSLCAACASLKEIQSDDSEAPHSQLFTMLMGYFYGSSPHIKSGAVAALSLLLYKDADTSLSVPNLLSSVLALLKKKETEVIKAVLGFIKVLVCSLRADELRKQLPDIISGIIPWSSVSKHHFRSKVKLIFEIMLRKCGSTSVNEFVPKKFQDFVRSVNDQHQGNSIPKEDHKSGSDHMVQSSSAERGRKRKYSATSDDKHFGNHERKREKFKKSQKKSVMNDSNRANLEDRGKGAKNEHFVSKRKSYRSSKMAGNGKRMHGRDNKKRRKESNRESKRKTL